MSLDQEFYAESHYDLFGHWPLPAADGSRNCIHPLHDRLQRLIDGPGVDVEIPFDAREVIDDDSEYAIVSREKYQEAVRNVRSELRELDEEDRFIARDPAHKRLLF